jgi:hypothetical protein
METDWGRATFAEKRQFYGIIFTQRSQLNGLYVCMHETGAYVHAKYCWHQTHNAETRTGMSIVCTLE